MLPCFRYLRLWGGSILLRNGSIIANNGVILANNGTIIASHDLLAGSHDLLAGSHDLLAERHDLLAGSHDLLAGSHDLLAGSHDLLAERHDLLAGSPDLHPDRKDHPDCCGVGTDVSIPIDHQPEARAKRPACQAAGQRRRRFGTRPGRPRRDVVDPGVKPTYIWARVIMNRIIIILTIATALAAGQWVEDSIVLGQRPNSPVVCPRQGKLYARGSRYANALDSLYVVDMASGLFLRSLSVGADMVDLTLSPSGEKLYAVCYDSCEVVVIGTGADTVIARIRMPSAPYLASTSVFLDKVYCGTRGGLLVSLDPHGDSVIAAVHIGSDIHALACDPAGELVSVTSRGGSVTLVSGLADTIRAVYSVALGPIESVIVSEFGRVYVACQGTLVNPDSGCVTILDVDGDSILTTIMTGYFTRAFSYGRRLGKVYCWAFSGVGGPVGLRVFDVAGDSLLVNITEVGGGRYTLYDSAFDNVYVSSLAYLLVVSGAQNLVLDTLLWYRECGEMASAYRFNRIYVTIPSGLAVIRTDPPGIEESGTVRVEHAGCPTILRAPELARFEGRVLDIQGRDVTEQKGALRPGVYFVRPKGPRGQGAEGPSRKVIVTK